MRQFSFIFSGLALVLAAAALTHSLRSNDRFDFDFDIPPQLAQAPGFYPLPAGPTGICPAGACSAAVPPTACTPPVATTAVSSPEVLECSSEEEDSECAVGRCGIDVDCGSLACALCDDSIHDNIQAFEQFLRLEIETTDSPEPRYVELHKAIVKCLDVSKLDQAAGLLEELARERSGTPEGERAAAALAQLKGTPPTPPEPLKSVPEPLKGESEPLQSTPQDD
jgi:hypothetical protein